MYVHVYIELSQDRKVYVIVVHGMLLLPIKLHCDDGHVHHQSIFYPISLSCVCSFPVSMSGVKSIERRLSLLQTKRP